MPPIIPVKKQPTASDDHSPHAEAMRQSYAPYKKIFDVDVTLNSSIMYNSVEEYAGSHDMAAVVSVLGSLHGKTYEERINIIEDFTAHILAGDTVFHGQPDPAEVLADSPDDYYDLQASYVTELLVYASNFSMEDYTQYSIDLKASYEEKEGLKYVVDGKEIKPLTNAAVGTGISDVEFMMPFKEEIYRRAAILQDKQPHFATRKAEHMINVWKENKPETISDISTTDQEATAINSDYMLRGGKILADLATKHFSRERPSFFARLFRTKEAKEYAAERTMMESIAKTLDAEQKRRVADAEYVDYSKFLNRKTAPDAKTAFDSSYAFAEFNSPVSEELKGQILGKLDAALEKIENFYASPDYKKALETPAKEQPAAEQQAAEKNEPAVASLDNTVAPTQIEEHKEDPELANRLSDSLTESADTNVDYTPADGAVSNDKNRVV